MAMTMAMAMAMAMAVVVLVCRMSSNAMSARRLSRRGRRAQHTRQN
jgi:hypothetical protein